MQISPCQVLSWGNTPIPLRPVISGIEQRAQDQGGLRTQPETTRVSIARETPGRVVLKGVQQSNVKTRKNQNIFMAQTLQETEFKLPERLSAPGRNEKIYFKAQQ